jgi:hypothetical protein
MANIPDSDSTGSEIQDDLKKVERESEAKLLRHRADDYVAMALGVGSVILLWILQSMGLY